MALSQFPNNKRQPAAMPGSAAEWDAYVRAERVRQGLAPELSLEAAREVAAILVRSRYPAGARSILRQSHRRRDASAGSTVIEGRSARVSSRLSSNAA